MTMVQDQFDVFISYSRKDTKIADEICGVLDANGVTYFIDRQGINGGLEFPEVLSENIINSTIFLFLASENSYDSKFTTSEVIFAFNKKPKNAIFPYIIDDSIFPQSLEFVFAGINWRNISDHPIRTTMIDDLLNLLGKVPPSVAGVNCQQRKNGRQYLLSLPDEEFEYCYKEGKYGYKLKSTGEIVIPCKYTSFGDFCNGYASVECDGKYGEINKAGEEIISCKYDDVKSFDGEMAIVQLDNKFGVVDCNGNEIVSIKYDSVEPLYEGLFEVEEDGKYGFVDKLGAKVIPIKYDDADYFCEGLVQVKENEQWQLIRRNGEPFKCDSMFVDAAQTVVENGIASWSLLQRNLEVGFNRAGRIRKQLIDAGIVVSRLDNGPFYVKSSDLSRLKHFLSVYKNRLQGIDDTNVDVYEETWWERFRNFLEDLWDSVKKSKV